MTYDELDALRDVSPRIDKEERVIDGRRVTVPVMVGGRAYWQEPNDCDMQDRHGNWWKICRDGQEMVKQECRLLP